MYKERLLALVKYRPHYSYSLVEDTECSSITSSVSPSYSRFRFINMFENIKESKLARFADKLQVESEPGLTNAQLMLANEDLKPVEPARRTWGSINFIAFWISDSFNINTWVISSSNIVDGLSWWQSWLCVWIGYSIAACFVCLTGRIGMSN